jgi:serine/threonine-protein kinase RsbW
LSAKPGKIPSEITVNSTTDNLSSIRNFVQNYADELGLDSEITSKIVLAVDEACTNIIKHAYRYSPNGKITLKLKTDKKKFSVTIIDEGGHFDPQQIPDPNLEQMQHEKRGGGLGMFLMKKLMDEVEYSNLTGNRNKVVLVKYIN